ncbi:MAG: J domain-containing protein [Eggerthellaceae bacterium]|nr:J domain-containing protein [Eggerthellaceae bacterium]
MNRLEALHILGLGDDATPEEIKTAYKETVQILHPDKFANNKKLQDRATEQFKNLQAAYGYLMSGKGAKARHTAASASASSGLDAEAEIRARLAGIAAARAQLVAQRDAASDERRNGLVMAGIGAVAALLTFRRPFGVFGLIAAAGTAAVVWGIVQVISAGRTVDTINEHLRKLSAEKKKLTAELEDME